MKEEKEHSSPEQQYKNQINQILTQYLENYPKERKKLSQLFSLIHGSLNLTDRKNHVGHLTASAVVINSEGRVLLLHHRNLDKWLQPGGHIDGLETPLYAALREIREETSITGLQLHPHFRTNQLPFDIDTHTIPTNQDKKEAEHPHHDFRYLFLTKSDEVTIKTSEIITHSWFDIEKAIDKRSEFPWQKILDFL